MKTLPKKILKGIFLSVLFAVLFLLVLALVGYFIPLSGSKVNQFLSVQLKQRLNKQIFIQKVRIYPLRKIEIERFAIKDKKWAVSAEKITLRYKPFLTQKRFVLKCNLKIDKIIYSQNFLSELLATDIDLLKFNSLISDFFISKEGIYIKNSFTNGDKMDISFYGKLSRKGDLDCDVKIYANKSLSNTIPPRLSLFLFKDEAVNSSKQKVKKSLSLKLSGDYKNPSVSFEH